MTEIHKSAEVPYTAVQMYNLVNDIESYPAFLPWCTDARVLQPGTHQLTASLTLESGKIKQSFSTQNTMQPGSVIEVKLLKGPFKHLTGAWHFQELDEGRCRISMVMSFEFKNRLLKMALNGLFSKIIDSLISAFSKRARELYG